MNNWPRARLGGAEVICTNDEEDALEPPDSEEMDGSLKSVIQKGEANESGGNQMKEMCNLSTDSLKHLNLNPLFQRPTPEPVF